MRTFVLIAACFYLAGCEVSVQQPQSSSRPAAQPPAPQPAGRAAGSFDAVVRRVEPVAERTCLENTRGVNCDFRIVVDTRPGLPPNAFQTLDKNGRPIIGFTVALINDVRNPDELAFIMGHEAAHHVAGHIPQTQQRALEGALVGGVLAVVLGADPATVETAQKIGGTVGARRFAKEFELQADALGTVITARSGFNPVRGAQYFARIPDPGNQFLGTHPPNADRIETVRRVAAGL